MGNELINKFYAITSQLEKLTDASVPQSVRTDALFSWCRDAHVEYDDVQQVAWVKLTLLDSAIGAIEIDTKDDPVLIAENRKLTFMYCLSDAMVAWIHAAVEQLTV